MPKRQAKSRQTTELIEFLLSNQAPPEMPQGRRGVGFLTLAACALVIGLALSHAASASSAAPADIAAAARDAVIAARGLDPERTLIEAQAPDARLRLSACDRPLTTARLDARPGARRETVRVACTGSTPWKVYVPVTVSQFEQVVTIAHNLPRGHILDAADLGSRKLDASRLPGGYLLRAEDAIGHVLTQSVAAGSVLRPNQLKADDAIRRGQAVALISGTGPVAIRMGGVALNSAPVGGRIRARNASSGAIVEGIALNAAEVRVTGRR